MLLKLELQDESEGVHLGIFELEAILPGQKASLQVFESRYIAMTRQALATGGRFGMTAARDPERLTLHGTEVEITECRRHPDGRQVTPSFKIDT